MSEDARSEPSPARAAEVAALGALDPAGVRYGTDGLVAAVVQDEADGRVLMVAWQDAEALAATVATGQAHFHSRSRGRLWRKGEESGNVLEVTGIAWDCDADAILLTARPAGPTCHTGTRSCFDAGASAGDPAPGAALTQDLAWLEQLWATIEERARTRPEGSYTARLLAKGVDGPSRKVAEEAVEVLMAAKDDAVAQAMGAPRDQGLLAGEMADLLYHLLVVCAERGMPPGEVIAVLRARHG
ncbi:MAG: bifunctional phosphoribosyl-AMP cyclohydrolase/phosphoribosyl-ATP diphosphatase HisIE [Chloroflexota bacterium]